MNQQDATIEPFVLDVPQREVDDLRRRLRDARLPERETVSDKAGDDWSQGVPLAYLTEVVDDWAERYDWRRLEREVGAHEPATTRIDGLDVVFLHIRSSRPEARPLILTHGWPSSIIEPLEVARMLAEPKDADAPAFHVVAPALPGFGPSGKPTATGWSVDRTADAWAELMGRLGYDHFVAAGGDWGGRVTAALAARHPLRVQAMHTFTPYVDPPLAEGELGAADVDDLAATRAFWQHGGGYSLEQSTRPQTLAYALTDSPVGQLAWILEKFRDWTDCGGIPENAVSRDRILDTVSLYWFTRSGGSSARFYWENFPPANSAPVEVPTAVTVFPRDIERLPRAWVERRFRDLQIWSRVDRGGHFPMLEAPDLYVSELRHSVREMLG